MLLSSRRVGAALAAACLLALTGCSNQTQPNTTPTPTQQPSPPETRLERQQRLDFEAAEKSYRAFMAEKNRLALQGGATEPSRSMKETAAGPYLEFYTTLLSNQKKAKKTHTAGTTIGYVRRGGYSPEELALTVCEDGSSNRVLDKNGKQISTGQILLRELYVRPVDGKWKVWVGEEKGEVETCAN